MRKIDRVDGEKTSEITLSLLVAYVVFFSLCFPAWTLAGVDFPRVIGFNAASMSRGGNTIAVGGDPSNMNVNPALVSETEGNALEINLLSVFKELEFTYTGTNNNTYTSNDKDSILLAPGFSYAHKDKGSPWSWGVTFAAPDFVASDYTIQSKNFGPANGSSEIIHLRFGPAVAYQVTPSLSIGVRLGIDYGWLDLRLPLGLAYLDFGQCDGFGFSAGLGLLYKPSKNLSLGLYYESATVMQDLKSKNADGYINLMTPWGKANFFNLDIEMNNVQFPQNFGCGVAFEPLPAWRFCGDIKYLDWSRHWDELEVVFVGPGAAAMDAIGLPGALRVPVHADNQITFGLGAEYFFRETFTLSVGYHYGNNAMGDNYTDPYIPAEVEHTITCGVSVKSARSFKLGMCFAYALMDDSRAGSPHPYDQSLEMQLGLPPGALDSEFSGSKTDYAVQIIQLSFSIYW
ncbi:MAG: outer membrane protein transport protein [Thermodesulfobacteriota bacterium]|nr:outer membrane protein transport protein [Thermodesulfobacteriota bacterium]